MKIALFGRTIAKESLTELSAFIGALSKVKPLAISLYEPFYREIVHIAQNDAEADSIIALFGKASTFDSYENLPIDTDLFFSLGGDGTFLSSLPFIRDARIPVVGLNFGRLGFLTSSKIGSGDRSSKWLEDLLHGEFTLQRRPLLRLSYAAVPSDFYPYALNEFAIQRKGPAVLELNIKINGTSVPKYVADGVLISTSTGSTAYSLSAGGPIVMPECNVMTVVPIAPHNLNIRPLVIPDSSTVEISFTTRYDVATVTADNRSFDLPCGAVVTIAKSPFDLNVVTPDIDFMSALSQKLYWGADWRQL